MNKLFLSAFKILFFVCICLGMSQGHGQTENFKEIQQDQQIKLMPLNASRVLAVEFQDVLPQGLTQGSPLRKELVVKIELSWVGCGGFSENATLLLASDSSQVAFFTLVRADYEAACQKLPKEWTRRWYEYRHRVAEPEVFRIGEKIEVSLEFLENNDPSYKPILKGAKVVDRNFQPPKVFNLSL
jgi:hypothetical protein